MVIALWLLALQGVIGAFDTIYYHEWRARLPARGRQVANELRLHAVRDFLYAVIFASLPWMAWQGWWAGLFVLILAAEIILTMADFIIEKEVRQPFGDVYAGERVTHAVMGILYGAMLASLLPELWHWWQLPTSLVGQPAPVAEFLRWALTIMAIGVGLSGIRDLYAASGLPGGAWPWPRMS